MEYVFYDWEQDILFTLQKAPYGTWQMNAVGLHHLNGPLEAYVKLLRKKGHQYIEIGVV